MLLGHAQGRIGTSPPSRVRGLAIVAKHFFATNRSSSRVGDEAALAQLLQLRAQLLVLELLA